MTIKLLLSSPRGFCAGVVRAIDTVKEALKRWGPPIYVKHEIVHNRHVVRDLELQGAIFVEELSEVPEGARVVYSAHGIPPAVREEARARQIYEIDATCGLVTKVHSAAKRYADKGYTIVLIGHRKHVEIIGTYGEAPDSTVIVESVADVKALTFSPQDKLVYLTQTTLSLDDVREITEALKLRFPQVETLPSSSICYATTNRQMALQKIAQECDLVIVVGDTASSNSNRLREVAERRGVKAFLINHEDEIDSEWLDGVKTIGLTAGASTPEELVQRVIARLKSLGVGATEEVIYTEENVFFQLPRAVLA